MPWKESSVMEERLRFVARLLDGRSHDRGLPGFRHIAQDRLQDFRSLQGTRAGGAQRSLPAAGALCQPAPDSRSRRLIVASSPRSRTGARARSASFWCAGSTATSRFPAKSTIHAVLDRHGLVKRSGVPRHRAQRHAAVGRAPRPTSSGAPTSRASSSSAMAATATR